MYKTMPSKGSSLFLAAAVTLASCSAEAGATNNIQSIRSQDAKLSSKGGVIKELQEKSVVFAAYQNTLPVQKVAKEQL
jgi:uncharacterized membrane protein